MNKTNIFQTKRNEFGRQNRTAAWLLLDKSLSYRRENALQAGSLLAKSRRRFYRHFRIIFNHCYGWGAIEYWLEIGIFEV